MSKAIDKVGGQPPTIDDRRRLAQHIRERRLAAGIPPETVAAWFPYKEVTKNWERLDPGNRTPSVEDYELLIARLGCSSEFRAFVRAEVERAVVGRCAGGLAQSWAREGLAGYQETFDVTIPATDSAKVWDGYATSLKPAWEPILVFRKPLIGTVAENVLAHGTGALNIAACRVDTGEKLERRLGKTTTSPSGWTSANRSEIAGKDGGRWPANLTLTHTEGCRVVGTIIVKGDPREGGEGERPGGFVNIGADKGSDKPCGKLHGNAEVDVYECAPGCPVAELNRQSGVLKSGTAVGGLHRRSNKDANCYGHFKGERVGEDACYGDTGGASRFFPTFQYVAKASGRERGSGLDDLYWRREKDVHVRVAREEWEALPPAERAQGNIHNTVKPLTLMQWLARLVGGQPGSIILDPFAGSGTTLIAALLEGFKTVGIEQSPEYVEIARRRIEWRLTHPEGK